MTTFVALLRAVNVSGQNKISMAELRRALGGLGLTGVETYLQSGNVVFDAQGDDPAELAQVATGNPFLADGADEKYLHVTLLFGPADADGFAGRDLSAQEGERAERAGPVIYLYLPHGYGRTKLNNAYFERALATPATTRNWRTVPALVEMSARTA